MDKGPASSSDGTVTTQPGGYNQGGYSQPGYYGPGAGYSSQQTTVIIQQPGIQMVAPRKWSTEVCGCFEDLGSCCYGTFCGWCMAMGLAEDLGESACVPCCVPGALIVMRTKMRMMYQIEGSIMDDCCTIVCCGHCALCQMAREMQNIRASNVNTRM